MSASSNERKEPKKDARASGGNALEEGVALRAQADEVIGGWWKYLPLAAVAFGLGGFLAFVLLLPGLSGLIFGYVVMYIAGFAMLAILTYKQTRRLTGHMSREALVRLGMLERIHAKAGTGAQAKVGQEISEMEGIREEASKQEKLPNQAYAAMSALPLVGLVVGYYYLYRLSREAPSHDERWLKFLQASSSASTKLDLPAPTSPPSTVTKRSFTLYALVSLAFFPFLAYWYHLMIKEVNQHFREQWKVEDELLSSTRTD